MRSDILHMRLTNYEVFKSHVKEIISISFSPKIIFPFAHQLSFEIQLAIFVG